MIFVTLTHVHLLRVSYFQVKHALQAADTRKIKVSDYLLPLKFSAVRKRLFSFVDYSKHSSHVSNIYALN
jgi:hypothetical protein